VRALSDVFQCNPAVDGDDSKGKDQSDTVRQTLLNWTRQSFQSMGNVAPINDFWARYSRGCLIVCLFWLSALLLSTELV